MKRILVVEDDRMLNNGLCYNLEAEGYSAVPVYTYKEGLEVIGEPWDLVLLDVNLPDGSGYGLCRRLKERCKAPVIFLTACDMDEDTLKGYEAGGDDYVTKPFNIEILLHRIRVAMRLNSPGKPEVVRCGNLQIDFEARTVQKGGEPVFLTPTEFKLLRVLFQNKGQVLTRPQLLEYIWDSEGNFVDEHTLTTSMSRLRTKLSDGNSTYIRTVYGVGYGWTGDKNE